MIYPRSYSVREIKGRLCVRIWVESDDTFYSKKKFNKTTPVDSFEYMYSTLVFAKNGEIFEGDILAFGNSLDDIGVVEFSKSIGGFITIVHGKMIPIRGDMQDTCEILGDLYRNRRLINKVRENIAKAKRDFISQMKREETPSFAAYKKEDVSKKEFLPKKETVPEALKIKEVSFKEEKAILPEAEKKEELIENISSAPEEKMEDLIIPKIPEKEFFEDASKDVEKLQQLIKLEKKEKSKEDGEISKEEKVSIESECPVQSPVFEKKEKGSPVLKEDFSEKEIKEGIKKEVVVEEKEDSVIEKRDSVIKKENSVIEKEKKEDEVSPVLNEKKEDSASFEKKEDPLLEDPIDFSEEDLLPPDPPDFLDEEINSMEEEIPSETEGASLKEKIPEEKKEDNLTNREDKEPEKKEDGIKEKEGEEKKEESSVSEKKDIPEKKGSDLKGEVSSDAKKEEKKESSFKNKEAEERKEPTKELDSSSQSNKKDFSEKKPNEKIKGEWASDQEGNSKKEISLPKKDFSLKKPDPKKKDAFNEKTKKELSPPNKEAGQTSPSKNIPNSSPKEILNAIALQKNPEKKQGGNKNIEPNSMALKKPDFKIDEKNKTEIKKESEKKISVDSNFVTKKEDAVQNLLNNLKQDSLGNVKEKVKPKTHSPVSKKNNDSIEEIKKEITGEESLDQIIGKIAEGSIEEEEYINPDIHSFSENSNCYFSFEVDDEDEIENPRGYVLGVIKENKKEDYIFKSNFPISDQKEASLLSFLYVLHLIENTHCRKIYMNSSFLANAFINNFLVQWRKNNWRKNGGGKVSYPEKWEEIYQLAMKKRMELFNTDKNPTVKRQMTKVKKYQREVLEGRHK